MIVALDGDLAAVDPDHFARQSGLPEEELSRNAWTLKPEAARATGT